MSGERSLKEKLLEKRPHLILIFIPILFTIIFGAVMSPVYVENIPLAVFDRDQSSKSRAIVDCFYDCPTFSVREDFETEEEIEEAMLEGDVKGALLIPEGFDKELSGKTGGETLLLIDGTNFLVGNNIQLYGSTILAMAGAEVQMKMLEAGGMVPYMAEESVYTMNIADRVLYNPELGYFYYLFAALLGLFVQQTIMAVTPAILIQEKNRLKKGQRQHRVGEVKLKSLPVAQKIGAYAGLNTFSALVCLIVANQWFDYPLKGNLGYFLLIHSIFLLCCLGVSLVLAAIFDDVTHCIQFVMFLAIPTILTCGYGWPEYMMAPGFAPVVKILWPLYYYVNPMKDLMLKGAGYSVIGHYIVGGILFAACWIPAGLFLFHRKITLLKAVEIK